MIAPGEKLPADLALAVVVGGIVKTAPLRELLTRRTILSIYMRNNTPSCDRQVRSLAAYAEAFDRLGWDIVALSRDSCGSHVKYAEKNGVGFTLASDPDDTLAKAADAVVEKSMYGKTYLGPARCALVLDHDGTVLAVVPKVDTKDHTAQLQAVIATL